MLKKTPFLPLVVLLFLIIFSPFYLSAKHDSLFDANQSTNPIPPRLQWNSNGGYCGEVCLISAGLYYGQYISQYDARALANNSARQKSQLLLGVNDQYAAFKMHLNSIEWDADAEQNTDQFLAWVKQNVVKGYPVAIGVYMNEYLFYDNADPEAGEPDYDHIVSVTGIGSHHSLSNPHYFDKDTLSFSDNGLWGNATDRPYTFTYVFGDFQATRKQANAKKGSIYSLSYESPNYGIAITGVIDLNHETLPVRVETNLHDERPEIEEDSNTRPLPERLTLTITVSGLQPHVLYTLYRYNNFDKVPDSDFNQHAQNAYESWEFVIKSGNSYQMTQEINSDEIAIYRAVKARAL